MTALASRPARAARRRGPGRPRNEHLDERILSATLGLIDSGEPVTVAKIVEAGGVNRAAIYRRWSSLTDLVAAALDVGRQVQPPKSPDVDLHEEVLGLLVGSDGELSESTFSEARFRQRIALAMADRELQRAYWRSHVARRRASLEDALRLGVERGVLREDVDPEAAFDLLAGVVYYQLVVRGESIGRASTRERCREAFEIAWRGMVRS